MISDEALIALLAEVRTCDICGAVQHKLCVDHDHVTHQIRGLLCSHCNRGLGHFRDNPILLRRAIGYLSRGVHNTKRKLATLKFGRKKPE
jgi:hypothetical protein